MDYIAFSIAETLEASFLSFIHHSRNKENQAKSKICLFALSLHTHKKWGLLKKSYCPFTRFFYISIGR